MSHSATEKYLADTGLGDLWREIAGCVQEHMIAHRAADRETTAEHGAMVVRSLLSIGVKVAKEMGINDKGVWIFDADAFAEMARDVFAAAQTEEVTS